MLQETLLLGPARTPTDGIDHPSILQYDLHTSTLLTSLRRSQTSPHCLSATSTHIFAAQSDKAVINIYSLATSTLESTLPLPEKPSVLTTSPCGALVAFGTPSGRIYLWELSSARFVATPQTHLQDVTALSFSASSTLLISGSRDSNLHVWSVPHLLDTRDPIRRPTHTLSRHAHAITALALSRASSGGPADLLVSASAEAVIAWDPHSGRHLRTYIPPAPVTALALDPADRAVYVGCEDGGVVTVDLHSPLAPQKAVFEREFRDVPITLPVEARWAEGAGVRIGSMVVSYEGNMLITGDAAGRVKVWDVATGRLWRVLAEVKAPVEAMVLNAPGRRERGERVVLQTVPKGRYENVLAATSGRTYEGIGYGVAGVLTGGGRRRRTMGREADEEVVRRGAREMERFGGAVARGQKVERLQEELAQVYEQYERLRKVQGKTWEALVEKVSAKE